MSNTAVKRTVLFTSALIIVLVALITAQLRYANSENQLFEESLPYNWQLNEEIGLSDYNVVKIKKTGPTYYPDYEVTIHSKEVPFPLVVHFINKELTTMDAIIYCEKGMKKKTCYSQQVYPIDPSLINKIQ